MKKLWLAGIGVTLAFLLLPSVVVRAHESAEDSGISALLHIEPHDDPSRGEAATYVFTFGDEHDGFDLHDYNCAVVIDGSETTPLNVESPLSGTIVYTIRSAGTHRLELVCKGNGDASGLKPFTLVYGVNVASEPIDTKFSPYLAIGLGSMIAILVGGALYAERRR